MTKDDWVMLFKVTCTAVAIAVAAGVVAIACGWV